MLPRPSRKMSLAIARSAGYHDDAKAYTRAIIEGRVNRQDMALAWVWGKTARARGVQCTCPECKNRRNQP